MWVADLQRGNVVWEFMLMIPPYRPAFAISERIMCVEIFREAFKRVVLAPLSMGFVTLPCASGRHKQN